MTRTAEGLQEKRCSLCGYDNSVIPFNYDSGVPVHHNPDVGWVLECTVAKAYADLEALRTELDTSKEANEELTAQRDCFWDEAQSLKAENERLQRRVEKLAKDKHTLMEILAKQGIYVKGVQND